MRRLACVALLVYGWGAFPAQAQEKPHPPHAPYPAKWEPKAQELFLSYWAVDSGWSTGSTESIWYLPGATASDYLMLANASTQPLAGSLVVSEVTGRDYRQAVNLGFPMQYSGWTSAP